MPFCCLPAFPDNISCSVSYKTTLFFLCFHSDSATRITFSLLWCQFFSLKFTFIYTSFLWQCDWLRSSGILLQSYISLSHQWSILKLSKTVSIMKIPVDTYKNKKDRDRLKDREMIRKIQRQIKKIEKISERKKWKIRRMRGLFWSVFLLKKKREGKEIEEEEKRSWRKKQQKR